MTRALAFAALALAAFGFSASRTDTTAERRSSPGSESPAVPTRISQAPAPVETPEEAPVVVEWMTEKEAKASGKPVLYLATLSKGCAPCAKLKGLLDNPITAEAMNRFACVLVEDPPANHPWMAHWHRHAARSGNRLSFPFMVFDGESPFLQVGAPPDVPLMLQFLDQMEQRAAGKSPAVIVPDDSKTNFL